MTRASMILVTLCYMVPALAQGGRLVDPTRPPNAFAQTAKEEPAAASEGPQLQSVLISPTRRVAVISGRTVVQGERFGDATVTAIEETSVLLQSKSGRQTLRLLPAVTKRERDARLGGPTDRGSSK